MYTHQYKLVVRNVYAYYNAARNYVGDGVREKLVLLEERPCAICNKPACYNKSGYDICKSCHLAYMPFYVNITAQPPDVKLLATLRENAIMAIAALSQYEPLQPYGLPDIICRACLAYSCTVYKNSICNYKLCSQCRDDVESAIAAMRHKNAIICAFAIEYFVQDVAMTIMLTCVQVYAGARG